ncbi:MAG TPA: FAD-dependent oxidoreductase [Lacipirellula sp.]
MAPSSVRSVCAWTLIAVIVAPASANETAPQPTSGRTASASVGVHDDFDVVIAGGSTAALAAAITACDEGARVALLEPTDWPGGQLTASGVPAVDEAWHKIVDPQSGDVLLNVAQIARDPRNMTPLFRDMLVRTGNPGRGWVSRFCFEPRKFLEREIEPLLKARQERLRVFRETVVKRVEVDDRGETIVALVAIQRTPRSGLAAGGYDVHLSADLKDWYDPEPSPRFAKRLLRFQAKEDSPLSTVFIDATEWGELLVLSGAPYLQGVEPEDGSLKSNDRCGQSTVFAVVQELHAHDVDEPDVAEPVEGLGFGDYRDRDDAWQRIWTYRRIRGTDKAPRPGDLSLQNWGYSRRLREGGNDYPFGYLFKSRAAAAVERSDWHGGVDLGVMAAAERRALAWHEWFKRQAPDDIGAERISLNREVLGTAHGLSKLPYIRDTRRSIGLDNFILRFSDMSGSAQQQIGTKFHDRVALGAYPADVHRLASCEYPPYIDRAHDTLPFHIPLRALTNRQFKNLLVAGKTMAQSFLANSATRLHPIEWSSGAAGGVAAAAMAKSQITSRQLDERVGELQEQVRRYTPIDWQVDP